MNYEMHPPVPYKLFEIRVSLATPFKGREKTEILLHFRC